MEITEVRIKLMEDSDDRLQAFCSITFDNCFVVRDLKIIEGTHGPFVAMPSRKLTSHCSSCGAKNHLRAAYCNQCGAKQREDRLVRDADGRAKLYADIAHPINSVCREMIQTRVIAEFQSEVERAQQPGYQSRYDDDYGYDAGEDYCPSQDDRRHAGQLNEVRVAASTGETRFDHAHGEGAAKPPHLPPPTAASENGHRPTPHKPSQKRGEFGAGIFD